MKKIAFLLVLAVFVYGYLEKQGVLIPNAAYVSGESDSSPQAAYRNRLSNVQIQGYGVVIRLLPDDNSGSRHQKFILELDSGQTLLIAHNIDLAPRISEIKIGDTVGFYGEYEWNSKGGVLHWTHHDPNNVHAAGWLKHNGNVYQ